MYDIKKFLKPTLKKIAISFLIIILLSSILALISGTVPFWYVVNSNAMAPAYSIGDIVFVTKTTYDEIQVGDVIIHSDPGFENPSIMRVIQKNEVERTYTTKGDANPTVIFRHINLTEDTIIAKVWFKIPLIGYLDLFYMGWFLRIFCIYLIACFLSEYTSVKNKSEE